MIYVIGGRGRLGQAIRASRPDSGAMLLDRAIYQDWWRDDAGAQIARYFDRAPAGSVVLVAAGLLDPNLPEAEHRRVNLDLPSQLIDAGTRAGLRVVTFGTVMERLVAHPNPYVATKAELGRRVQARAAEGQPALHLQIHTQYGGGEPAPFMFLGQMLQALREGRPFDMSPGRQLREYHHVDDDVAGMHVLLDAGATGVVALSHGAPCTLRDLASHVFAELGRPDLLRIGARSEPNDDNYATVLPRPEALARISFRPALQGVPTYLKTLLARPTLPE